MLTTLNTFNTTQKNVAVQARMRASAGPLFTLWKLGFGNILLRPLLSLLHSWPAVLLFHTPLPAVFLHSSRKCFFLFFLYGLLTSWEFFQSLGLSFHFQMSAMLTRAIRAPAVCRHGRATSMMRKGHQLMSAGMRYLIGYCVLIREPLSAWEVFIHCWYNLQYVVMWSKSCKRHNIN